MPASLGKAYDLRQGVNVFTSVGWSVCLLTRLGLLKTLYMFTKFGIRYRTIDCILGVLRSTECGIKSNPLRKLKFLAYFAVFSPVDNKVYTCEMCKFY